MNTAVFRNASAVIPLIMSGLALAIMLLHIATSGSAREADEGTATHIFQLLIAGQAPVVAFFAIKWLPRLPAEGLMVIGLQAGAAMLALAPVVIFQL